MCIYKLTGVLQTPKDSDWVEVFVIAEDVNTAIGAATKGFRVTSVEVITATNNVFTTIELDVHDSELRYMPSTIPF